MAFLLSIIDRWTCRMHLCRLFAMPSFLHHPWTISISAFSDVTQSKEMQQTTTWIKRMASRAPATSLLVFTSCMLKGRPAPKTLKERSFADKWPSKTAATKWKLQWKRRMKRSWIMLRSFTNPMQSWCLPDQTKSCPSTPTCLPQPDLWQHVIVMRGRLLRMQAMEPDLDIMVRGGCQHKRMNWAFRTLPTMHVDHLSWQTWGEQRHRRGKSCDTGATLEFFSRFD